LKTRSKETSWLLKNSKVASVRIPSAKKVIVSAFRETCLVLKESVSVLTVRMMDLVIRIDEEMVHHKPSKSKL
jgi:hypothetical protein